MSLIVSVVIESIRYIDVHPVLPEGSPPELQDSYDALLAPLLLNSALAAIRAQPQSTANALTAISSATRALNKLSLNDADKGKILHGNVRDTFADRGLSAAKALYRRSMAHAFLKDEEKAEQDLVEASALVPTDAAISAELSKIRQARKEKREKEKKQFKKMFS